MVDLVYWQRINSFFSSKRKYNFQQKSGRWRFLFVSLLSSLFFSPLLYEMKNREEAGNERTNDPSYCIVFLGEGVRKVGRDGVKGRTGFERLLHGEERYIPESCDIIRARIHLVTCTHDAIRINAHSKLAIMFAGRRYCSKARA